VSKRLLICGSRTWTDAARIHDELTLTCGRLGIREPAELTVIHGACPKGADKIADDWAKEAGAEIERWPADWNAFGKYAGPRRNEQMAQTRRRALPRLLGRRIARTADMIKRCIQHGITVQIVPMRGNK